MLRLKTLKMLSRIYFPLELNTPEDNDLLLEGPPATNVVAASIGSVRCHKTLNGTTEIINNFK